MTAEGKDYRVTQIKFSMWGEGLVGCTEVLSLDSLQSTDVIKHPLSCLVHQSCWLVNVCVITGVCVCVVIQGIVYISIHKRKKCTLSLNKTH